jgi:hypothetical protein
LAAGAKEKLVEVVRPDGARYPAGMRVAFYVTHEDAMESLKAHMGTTKQPPMAGSGHALPPNGFQVWNTQAATKRFGRSLLGWVLILVVAIVIFVVFHKEPPPAPAPVAPPVTPVPEGWLPLLLNVGPWMLIFVAFWFFFYRGLKRQRKNRKMFNEESLRQERTLEVTETGIRISVPTARFEFDWLAFQRVVETQNLFMLYRYPLEYQVVPKRAFAGEAELGAFRALLQEHIGSRQVGAFPVTLRGGG